MCLGELYYHSWYGVKGVLGRQLPIHMGNLNADFMAP